MISYRIHLDDNIITLHSNIINAPVLTPKWISTSIQPLTVYCILALKDGQCIVTTDHWTSDAILFIGFFMTDKDGDVLNCVTKQ